MVITQEASQDRAKMPSVESEIFHQTALNKRLEQIRVESPVTQSSDSFQQNSANLTLLDQTANRTTFSKQFNLNQFLSNSVYPAECEPDELDATNTKCILNASCLIDHLRTPKPTSVRNSNESPAQSQSSYNSIQFDPNDTIVDEDLVLSLTQKTSNTTLLNESILDEDENHLLDILEHLEDNEQNRNEQTCIDDDSVLAPLTQQSKEFISMSQSKNKENSVLITSFGEDDSDDDLLNEFSMSMMECMPDAVANSIEMDR